MANYFNMLKVWASLKTSSINMLSRFPKFHYGRINYYLFKLNRPLYYYIIVANVGVFSFYKLGLISEHFLYKHFTLNKNSLSEHRFHNIITHAFTHINFWHLGTLYIYIYIFFINLLINYYFF